MLISRKYQYIFLSNPKCGSSTFREMLASYSDVAASTLVNLIEDKERREEVKAGGIMHWPAYALKKNIEKSRDLIIQEGTIKEEDTVGWDDFYSFTTVRNPYRRIASWYFFLKPDKNFNTILGGEKRKDYDGSTAFHHHFNDWLEESFTNPERTHLPTHLWFCQNWENLQECLVDDIFKIEEIDDTFPEKFKEKTGITVVPPIPKFLPDHKLETHSKFSSFKGNYYDLYNEASKATVAKFYAPDLNKFNYEFGQ